MNYDITALLYGIKENIKNIENGNTGDSVLSEVRADFLDFMELIKLFLISERDSYYGYFLMNMQFRAEFCVNSIAGIKLNEFPPVLQANPLLLCKFTLKEIIYIICHEIDHVVLNHPAEMVKSNPEGNPDLFYEFNLAADAAVNDRINHEIVAEKGGELQLQYEDTNSVRAYVLLSNLDREDLASAGADILKTVWNDPGCGVSSGELNRLEIDCTENTGGRHAEGNYTVRLILQKTAETHRMEPEQPEVYRDTSDWMYDSVMVTDETDPVRSTVTALFADGADMFARHSAVE